MADFPGARIIANSNNKTFETVNINSAASLPDVMKHTVKRYTQVTAAVAAANKGKC